MKKLYLAIIMLTIATGANALVVADPTSHAYFIEQIAQADKKLETAKKSYDALERTAKDIERMGKQISGSYNNAGDVYKVLKNLDNNYDSMYRRLSKTEQRVFGRKIERQKSPVYKDLERVLKENGFDPASNKLYSATSLQKARMHDRQRRIKDAVMQADMIIVNLDTNIKRVKVLADKIDKTKNIKDSQDLGNRLAVEQLLYLDNMTRLLSTFASASMALKYSGYDELKHFKSKIKKGVSTENDPFGLGYDLTVCRKFKTWAERTVCRDKVEKASKGIK